MSRTARIGSALASLGTIAIALSPALDRLADASFAWHMVEHLLLMLVASFFALAAEPFLAFAALIGKRRTARFVQATRGLHGVASPAVTLSVFIGVLWVTHFSPLYNAALENTGLHILEHALYLGAGLLFWLPIVSPKPLRPLPYPARLLYAIVAMPQGALVAVALDASRRPLYAHYAAHASVASALADQQAGAAVMWIAGGGLLFIAFLGLLGSWARRETRFATLVALIALASVPVAARAASPNGAALYAVRCASCHGALAQGSPNAPPLRGRSASDIAFALDTGRMPATTLDADDIGRAPAFAPAQIRAIVAYVLSLSSASDRSQPHVGGGNPTLGRTLFAQNCQECHGAGGDGGSIGGASVAPSLMSASPVQIAEAVRAGPGMMPRFSARALSPANLSDIAAYIAVLQTQTPLHGRVDAGGIDVSHVGPVAEGAVGWLFGLGALVLVLVGLSRL